MNGLSIRFDDKKSLKDLSELEWIETNGLGGWSSSTVCCANTRRYHGILVSSLLPPVERYVMLSRLDETVLINEKSYPLSTRIYRDTVTPDGYHYLVRFEKDPFPTFFFEIPIETGTCLLKKTIAMPNGYNAVVIQYELLEAPGEIELQLEPFIAARDYHSLTQANSSIRTAPVIDDEFVGFKPYSDLPEIKISAEGASYSSDQSFWFYQFDYRKEIERGLNHLEDLFLFGKFSKKLNPNEKFNVLVTTEKQSLKDPQKLMDGERDRRASLLKKLPVRSFFIDTATLAADQFIVNRGDQSKTVIAGYHWFADWGRDTMISLRGLCLCTKRYDEAKNILTSFSNYINKGMIPNRFPDYGEDPEYNTVDATLWYIIAIYHYYQYTKDIDFLREMLPYILDIISWHDDGTRYSIRTDTDGLLKAGESFVQLTWMDAKVGGHVITPRTGKPVEINALWYNVMQILKSFAKELQKEHTAAKFEKRANQIQQVFIEEFWNESMGCLYDVVHKQEKDPSIRPNQIIALSLPYEIIDQARALKILEVVDNKLLTPFGLRSLDSDNPKYIPNYYGDQYHRDNAYHQGTVWGWLLGPYIEAIIRYRGEEGEQQARTILENFSSHFLQAGIGTLSEIFDAQAPHTPRGCIAQAWSVAEILRVSMKLHF